jgi:hypothetical protein
MPEDEGKNGNRWTDEASVLFKRIGWEKIADSNIDIEGVDGQQHGIDSLFRYRDGLHQSLEGVFVEAKRYRTTSFNRAKLLDWVDRLHEKMTELRRSGPFNSQYPAMGESTSRNGLLVLWFHDLENYPRFRSTLTESMQTVKTTRRRGSIGSPSRLFVLENEAILRLCSLLQAVQEWNNTNKADSAASGRLKFFYPSALDFGHPSQLTEVLNIEGLFSKCVLAKSRELDARSSQIVDADVVFYFGHLDLQSFQRLRSALLELGMAQSDHNLYIYLYQRDDDFRKIEPDVKKLFEDDQYHKVQLKTMDRFGDLPSWVKNEAGE